MTKPRTRNRARQSNARGATETIDDRVNAVRTLDLAWARREAPEASSDDVLLVALHKARYRCLEIEDALRHESAQWLRARGYSDLHGEPLLPPGELPA